MEGSSTGLVSLSSLGSGAKARPDSDFAELKSLYDALLRDHEELKSYALVSSSRESLARQLEQANSRIAELMTENIELEAENKELRARVSDLTHEVKTGSLQTRPDAEGFSERFGLPPTELPISRYRCGNEAGRRGKLFITPSYLCYHPKFNKDEDNCVLPLKSIVCVERVKGHSYTVGSGHAIELTLNDNSKKWFRSFYNVVGAMQDIATQAQKGGHVIRLIGPLT